MQEAYLGIVFLTVAAVLNAALLLVVSRLASVYRPTPAKRAAYESGIVPIGDTRERISVKFYIVAMLFIVFDIETIFFLPWAAVYRELGALGFIEMLIFVAVLAVGLAYAWKRGALEWN